jgi:uncharacterized protein YndB with AHSA1/START domain
MNREWRRKLDIAVPVERVWNTITNPQEMGVLLTPPENPNTPSVDPARIAKMEFLERVENERLRWRFENAESQPVAEFSIVFESTETGSRISLTSCGFGEDEESQIWSAAFTLGWQQGLMDLALYLETGQIVKRHYNGCFLSALGVMYHESGSGVEVRSVNAGSFGEQAGLERGDQIVRLADNPVYTRADVWQQIGMRETGSEISVEFIRNGELKNSSGKLICATLRAIGE